MEECLLNIGYVSLSFLDTPRVVSIRAGFWGEQMNIWLIIFFFVVAIGLVMLFVVGTSGGVAQQITSEDACDPYAKKQESNNVPLEISEDNEQRSKKMLNSLMDDSSTNLALAAGASAVGNDAMEAFYISESFTTD